MASTDSISLTDEFREAKERAHTLYAEVTALTQAVATAEAAADGLRSELDAVRAHLHPEWLLPGAGEPGGKSLGECVSNLADTEADVRAELERARAEAAAARADADTLRSELAALREELAATRTALGEADGAARAAQATAVALAELRQWRSDVCAAWHASGERGPAGDTAYASLRRLLARAAADWLDAQTPQGEAGAAAAPQGEGAAAS